MYEEVIPLIMKNAAYYDSDSKLLNIDKYLNEKYKYILKTGQYGWKL